MTSLTGFRGGNASTGSASGLKGTGYNQVSMPRLNPDQMQLFQQLLVGSSGGLQAGLSNLSQQAAGGSEDYWKQLEAPAMRQFGELQGQIASRFSGAGMGGRKSSGFNNAQSGAAAGLSEQLQSNRLGLQQSAIRDLLGLSHTLLGTDTQDNFLIPKKKPWWQDLLSGLGGAAGQAGGMFGGLGLGKWAGFLGK
jgi:hypothetical protein